MVSLNTGYVKSVQGILKILEIVSILSIIILERKA